MVFSFAKNAKVIEEYLHELPQVFLECLRHDALERGWCIAQPKWHDSIGKSTPIRRKGSLSLIFVCYSDLIISGKSV
jgi:hypothetical protein